MDVQPVPLRDRLVDLLSQVTQRRPYITALALMSPGGQLWAAVLPDDVEPESIAAMAAPATLLGRRIALEQLEGEMRQVYVEGERGYAILRAVGQEAILLAVAAADANLALVLHDVLQIEEHVAEAIGVVPGEVSKWTEAGPAIERLRRLVSEGKMPGSPHERLANLRDKLDSLDLGYFPERAATIRTKLDHSWNQDDFRYIEEIEVELLALERDVMASVEQQLHPAAPSRAGKRRRAMAVAPTGREMTSPVERPESPTGPETSADEESLDRRGSFIRRALRWLASIIASED